MAESGVCATCGASLPGADALGLITCPGCGGVTKLAGSSPSLDVADASAPGPDPGTPVMPPLQGWPAPPVAAPAPGGQWAAPPGVAGAPPSAPPTTPPRAKGKSRSPKDSDAAKTGRRIGCAIAPFVGVAIFGAIIFGAVRSCDVDSVTSSFKEFAFDSSQLTLSGSGTVLPATGDRADVVMVLQDTEDSETTRHVARISFTGDQSKLEWQSEALGDDTYRAEVALVADTLFAGVDDQVYALDPATGKTKWTATLRDKLSPGCDRCFASVGGRLVVRTTDAYVTAYGTRSSESLWERRLNSTSGSMSVAGGRLFIVDDPEDSEAITPVAMVDPASGRSIRTTAPRCPKSGETPWELEMSAGDEVLPVPGSRDVMAAFGFGDGCVVRWDPATGVQKWTSRLNGMSGPGSDKAVVGSQDLVLGGSGGPLVTVYLPNGKARELETPGDLTAQPSQIVGRQLVALTVTTRGTPKGGLAAWDLATGERTWANASLGTAQPVSNGSSHSSDALFDGTPRSLLVPVGKGLNVFVFEGTERTFTVAPIDLATGELGPEVRRAFLTRYDSGTPSLTIEGRSADRLVVSIDNLLQTIPVSGRGALASYPEKD